MKRFWPSVLGFALLTAASASRAEFLFSPTEGYLVPSFDGMPDTEFSEWDVFYAPNNAVNYPDIFAPNGTYQSALDAGFTMPFSGAWSPSNPSAYWHTANATIMQTSGTAFIIGPGTAGNIYSSASASAFVLADSTPYPLGTVVFQFQTEGSMADSGSIRLRYLNGGDWVELPADEMIREYQAGGTSFGGAKNRTALQWDLTGLGITDYEIVWNSQSSSMSFQAALLDTAATYAAVVPESRTWTAIGTGKLWSGGTNWAEGTTSIPNGNVRFQNASAAEVVLDSDRTVGEIIFDTAAGVTINTQGVSKITANTGITTTAAATGLYTINSPYEMGAFSLFDIHPGEVRLNGVLSGSYGFVKLGDGTLFLANNNSFGGGVRVEDGTLRVQGSNTYTAATAVAMGKLVVAAHAPSGSAGPLGNATTAVTVGASPIETQPEAAELLINGDFTIGRNISLEATDHEKRLGVLGTTTGAAFSGSVTLGSSSGNIKFTATGASDRLTFSGAITGGTTTKTLTLDGLGTVVYSGANKTYANATTVASGTLEIGSGTTMGGNGNMTVASGARLTVLGSLSGSGTLTVDGTLAGAGTISRSTALGGTISPGNNGIGSLAFSGALELKANSAYALQLGDWTAGAGTGYDTLSAGSVNITATAGGTFTVQVDGTGLSNFTETNRSMTLITSSGMAGLTADNWTVAATNFPGAGTWTLAVVGNALVLDYTAAVDPYASWASANGLTLGVNDAPEDDPDHDGLPNLLEYALAANPLNTTPAGGISYEVTETSLIFTFARSDDSELDTTQVFQWGSNLTGWTDIPVGAASGGAVTITENGALPDTIVVTIPQSFEANNRLFGRLKVTQPSP